AQVDRMLIAQTEQQPAFHGDPYPIAEMAELMTMGRNKPDTNVTSAHSVIAGRPTTGFRACDERIACGDARADCGTADKGLGTGMRTHLTEWHFLNKTQIQRFATGKFDQIENLVIIA